MRLWGYWITVALLGTAPQVVLASAPDQSLRPVIRASDSASAKEINLASNSGISSPSKSPRPKRRNLRVRQEVAPGNSVNKAGFLERLKSKKPRKRLQNPFGKRPKKGSVCGVNGIEGTIIEPVPGRIRGCGVSEPVRITAVDGVSLSQSAVIDCPTAKALYSWINGSVKPAVKRKGGGVKSIKVAAHYACRTRNNRKGARISEHGKGRAIDISAIQLLDGSSLTVLKDWRSRNKKIMRAIHKGACGPFGTVLGPNSDRYHQDHFHFDTARYRSGPYCR